VIEIRLEAPALAHVRYVLDPVWETVSAYQSLLSRESQVVHRRLAAVVAQARVPLGGLLAELLGDPMAMPGLVLPVPAPEATDPRTSFERILRTPRAELVDDLDWLRETRPTTSAASLTPRALAERTHSELWVFWSGVVAPMWPRLAAVAGADIAHRSARLASAGLGAALEGLHPAVSFTGDKIRIDKPQRVDVTAQDGLWLVPNVFRWPSIAARWGSGTPVLCYAARGAALVWDERRSADARVARLLGRSRADVLSLAGIPASTTEIAVELGLAKAGVSEHLSALTDAGLTTSRRSGRRVLYERTRLGDELMAEPPAGAVADRHTG
jgi:DNA-binding transcriptional ArsR family regulator